MEKFNKDEFVNLENSSEQENYIRNRDLVNADLSKIYIRNLQLSDLNFTDADLYLSYLDGSVLRYAEFLRTHMNNAKFSNIDAIRMRLRYSFAHNTVFEDSDLSYADFSYSEMNYSNFRGANLSYAIFQNTSVVGADFSGADLSCADLRNTGLSPKDLRNSYNVDDALFN